MLRNLWCILVAATWICVLMPFVVVAMVVTWDTSTSIWVARRLWSPALLWAGGARLEVSGQEHVDPARATIYLSTHQSTIDIPTLFMSLPVNVRFVAKEQLRWVPVMGWYMWAARYVFIDRRSRERAVASLERAARLIRSGISVVMFPEGTRSPTGAVLPFKKGPFVLALQAGVPVCPVTVEGTGKLMPKNSWNITPGPVRVRVGAPIDPTKFDSAEDLLRAARDAMITQSLALGGAGGDREDAVAAAGAEGVGRGSRAAA